MKNFFSAFLNDTKKLLIVGGILLSGLFLGVLFTIFSLITNAKNADVNRNTELNAKDKKIISEVINFSDKQAVDYKYQSPLFDFELNINTKEYDYRETKFGINIYNDSFTKQATIMVDKLDVGKDLNDVVSDFEDSNKYTTNYKLIKKEEFKIDGKDAYKIIYSYKSYSNNTVIANSNFTINNNNVYEFQYLDSEASSLTGDEINLMIKDFKFIDGNSIAKKIQYESTLWGYTFEYDPKTWIVNQGTYNINLVQRNTSLDVEKNIDIDIYSQEVSRSELKDNSSSFLDSKLTEKISNLKEKGYEIVSQKETDLAGRKVKFIEYKKIVPEKYTPNNYQEYLILHYNTYSTLKINYGKADLLSDTELLLNSFKIIEPTSGQVKGIDNTENINEKAAILTKPAVSQIYFQRCGSIYLTYSSKLPITSGKTYNLCTAQTGSGFFVNYEGYVATNGHVVTMSEATFKKSAYSLDLLINIFKDVYQPLLIESDPIKYGNLSDGNIISLIKEEPRLLYNLLDANFSLMKSAYEQMKITDSIYVQKGSNAFDRDELSSELNNSSSHLLATIVDKDFDEKALTSEVEIASDVALLKVPTSDYPTLTLGDNKYTITGSQVIAIGFPGAADSLGLINTKIESQETFTKGLVSKISTTTGDRKLLQIDASVSGGSSGGPLINLQNINVLGLVTYSITSGPSDYNYARDIADLKDMMKKNDITNSIGETQKSLDEGIGFFFEGKYSKAVVSLEKAKSTYSDLEGIDKLIDISNDKIAQGLDYKEPTNDILSIFNNLQGTEKILFVVVICLTCVISLLGFSILLIFTKLKKRATNESKGAVTSYNTNVVSPMQLPVQNVVPITNIAPEVNQPLQVGPQEL
jgi:hypothetical protein